MGKFGAQLLVGSGSSFGASHLLFGLDPGWWSYDTPEDITNKMQWVKEENLGGAFFWELSGDTDDGELIKALSNGLK